MIRKLAAIVLAIPAVIFGLMALGALFDVLAWRTTWDFSRLLAALIMFWVFAGAAGVLWPSESEG